MNIEKFIQFDNLLIDETNVKQIVREFVMTDKGRLKMVLDKGGDQYYFTLNDEKLLDGTQNSLREKGLVLEILTKQYGNRIQD